MIFCVKTTKLHLEKVNQKTHIHGTLYMEVVISVNKQKRSGYKLSIFQILNVG